MWNSRFWSQLYSDFSEINAPQATQYLQNPTAMLDFKRSGADQLRVVLNDQEDIVRELTPTIPLTTNFMLPTWNHYNQWDFAADIDVVSIDHYLDSATIDGEASKQVAEVWQTLLDEDLVKVVEMWTPEYWASINDGTIATVNYAA